MSKEARQSLRQSLMGISSEEMALRRQATFLEILQTEENYVKDLELVVEYFLEPIRKRDILDKEMISKIFSNWEELLSTVNRPFLLRLRQLESPDDVGLVFLDLADLFKMYAVYCSNQARIGEVIEQAKKSSPDLKKLDERALDDTKTRNQCLRDFLILPMQRVCRYPMLLESLLKYTDGSEVILDALKEAIFRYKALVAQINEWTRRVENVAKLSQIEKRFRDGKTLALVQPKRHFISEGRLKMRLPRNLGITSTMEVDLQDGARCFLFDDLLISAAPVDPSDSKSQLLVKFSLDLSRCFNVHVEDISDDTNKAGEEVGFEVVFQIGSESDPSKSYQKKFKFKAVSSAERDVWIKKFRELPLLIARRDVANLSQINQHLSGTLSPNTVRKVFVSSKSKSQGKETTSSPAVTVAGDDAPSSQAQSTAIHSKTTTPHTHSTEASSAHAMSLKLPKTGGDRSSSLSARNQLSSSSTSNLHKSSIVQANSSVDQGKGVGARRQAAKSNLSSSGAVTSRLGSLAPFQSQTSSKDQVEIEFDDDEDNDEENEKDSTIGSQTPSHALSSSQGSNQSSTTGGAYKRPAAKRVAGPPPNLPLPSLPIKRTITRSFTSSPSTTTPSSSLDSKSSIADPIPERSRSGSGDSTPPPPPDDDDDDADPSAATEIAASEKLLRSSGLSATSPRLFGSLQQQQQQQQSNASVSSNPTRANSSGLAAASKRSSPRGMIQTPSREDIHDVQNKPAPATHAKVGAAYGRFSGPSTHNNPFGPGPGPSPLTIPSPTIATGYGYAASPVSPPIGGSSLFGSISSPLSSPTLSSSPSTFTTLMNQQLARDFETLTLGFMQAISLSWPEFKLELPLNPLSLWEMLKQIEEEKKEQLEAQEFMRKAIATIRRRLETSSLSSNASSGTLGSGPTASGSMNTPLPTVAEASSPNMNEGLNQMSPAVGAPGSRGSSLDSLGDLITSISAGGSRSVSSVTSPRLLGHQTHFSSGDAASLHQRVSSSSAALSPPQPRSSPRNASKGGNTTLISGDDQSVKRTAQNSGEIVDDEDTVVDDRNTPRKAEPADTYSQVRRQNSEQRRGSYARSISYAGHTSNVISQTKASHVEGGSAASSVGGQTATDATSAYASAASGSSTSGGGAGATESESPRPNWPAKARTASTGGSALNTRFQSPPPNHAPPPTPASSSVATTSTSSATPSTRSSSATDSPRKRGSSVKIPETSKIGVSSPKASKRLSDRKESKKKL